MVIHLLRIQVAPQNHNSALQTFKSMIGATRSKAGCLLCSLYTDIDNDDELLIIEKWSSKKAFDEHVRSRHYGLLLEVMELAV